MPTPPRSPRPVKKSSGTALNLFLFLLALVLGVAVVLQFVGPYKGWTERVLHKKSLAPASSSGTGTDRKTAGTGVSLPPPPPASTLDFLADDGTSPLEIPEKTEYETEYEKLYNAFLVEAKKPKVGDNVRFRLRDGSSAKGILEEISPGKITLHLKYGTMTYPIDQIHPKDLGEFFPERVAHRRALAEMRRKSQAATAGDATPSPPLPDIQDEPETKSEPPPAPTPRQTGGRLVYDPSAEKTPERLMSTLTTFAEWLKGQHRRVGGRIADKIHAKQQGSAVVLYLHMNPMFLEQDYDTQFRIAEGIAKFWSFRCLATKVVPDPSYAHIVMMKGDQEIIGGSTPRDASAIWVKK